MSKEIIGNSYTYIVDEAYGINRDGFIAIGTESIVYKGLKTKRGSNLQFSCVLKFKPKSQIIDGVEVDNLAKFKEKDWMIFQELRECRSVVRIDDVIDDLGTFSMVCPHIGSGMIDSSDFFCVVEEFVDGWNLDEFCREEFWKLRKIGDLPNGLKEKVEFNAYSPSEKKAVLDTYTYEKQLKYQNQIMLFMLNLCEIMEYVTEKKKILHLDIKPENIMVTRYGKELVLIDFGRSTKFTDANKFATNELTAVDYSKDETQAKQYQYGTLGYAAPECYCEAAGDTPNPVGHVHDRGKMSIESDIFSFGATFWECLHMFELVTQTPDNVIDMYDFYKQYMLKEDAYCNRDLSHTSATYHQKLEKIIKKCTAKRDNNFRTAHKSNKFYHSYEELRKDIEHAKDSTPTIVKEENVKVRGTFKFAGIFSAIAVLILLVNVLWFQSRGFQIAENKFEQYMEDYNESRFNRMSSAARDYIAASPAGEVDATYDRIEKFTYENHGNIASYEASLLVELLEEVDNAARLPERVNTIMQKADPDSFKDITTAIVSLDVPGEYVGYDLAEAIYNVEVGKTGVKDAFDTLMKYKDNADYINAIVKLKNVLDTDEYVTLIAAKNDMDRQQVLNILAEIKK